MLCKSISSCAQYVMCTLNLDDKKIKYVGFIQEIGFGSVYLHRLQ